MFISYLLCHPSTHAETRETTLRPRDLLAEQMYLSPTMHRGLLQRQNYKGCTEDSLAHKSSAPTNPEQQTLASLGKKNSLFYAPD